MSRPISVLRFLKLFTPLALSSLLLAGCGSGSSGVADTGGGGGGGVVVEAPVTVTTTFDFTSAYDSFVVGNPPIHARFLGGDLDGKGAWIVREGDTAEVAFGTPVDAVSFSAKDNYGATAAKPGSAGAQKFDVPVFVRGTELGWEATPDKQMASVSADVNEVTLPLTTATTGAAGEFKIADAGWASVNCGANSSSDTITLGAAYTMACGTNPPNIKLNITADGNYKFSVNSADPTKPVLTVSKVTSGGGGGGGGGGGTGPRACGLQSQGLDNNAPFGVAVFVRGSVANDWAAAPANQLFQFGGNLLKQELQVDAGAKEFKIADAGWASVNCGAGDNADITVGAAFTTACGTNPPNIKFNAPAADCYEFAVNAANKDAPVVTIKKADLSGGGGEEPSDSVEIRIYAKDMLNPTAKETLYKTVKGTGTVAVDEKRAGGDTRITRIEIENLATAGDVGIEAFTFTANPRFSPAAKPVDVYYRPAVGSPTTIPVTINGKAYSCTPSTTDAFGCVVKGVSLYQYESVMLGVANGAGGTTNYFVNADQATQPLYFYNGVPTGRVGAPGQSGKAAAVPRNANEVIVFYKRRADDYDGWGIHLFPKDPAGADWTTWAAPHPIEGIDPQWGAYFRVSLPQNANPKYSNNPAALTTFPNVLGFILHKGDTKDPGPDQEIRIATQGNMVFVVSGVNDVGSAPPVNTIVKVTNYAAHWVTKDTVLYKAPAGVTSVEMLYSPDASIGNAVNGGFVGNFSTIKLTTGTNPKPADLKDLQSWPAFALPATAVANAKAIARSQIYIVGRNAQGQVQTVTRAQINGALDDLYYTAAKDVALGPVYTGGVPSVRVWAPTALLNPGVSLQLYNADGSKRGNPVPMTLDANTGVWSASGQADWNRAFYTFNLKVYSNFGDTIVTNEVSDPYAVSGNTDGARSQFVNLDDADTKPAGWDTMTKPALAAPEDIVVYELHVRDFSIVDQLVPAADRGKYTAFDVPNTNGRQHLQELAAAGLTHVHILPAFDIATVKENPADRIEIDDPTQKLCDRVADAASLCFNPANGSKPIRQIMAEFAAADPTSLEPQKILNWIRADDGFNWGYDPYHYGSPEGSYSTNPNGVQRVIDFRRMVKGLNDVGLRTVMDVVYNHTAAEGQAEKSVFDKLVPGYYHRRDRSTGGVTRATCCSDIATEWKMAEKVMFDTGLRWVKDYKVDGFRFDLMTSHTKDQMIRFRDAAKAINPQMYVYGEGWNSGPGKDDAQYVSARQDNLGGTGIGTFNDRIRDAIRGGGPFDSGQSMVTNQGIINGLWYDPNSANSGSDAEKTSLLNLSDRARAQLAGGIKSYPFENAAGKIVAGSTLGAYTEDPSELINYIEKHDNETLWDVSQYKHPAGTPTAARVRAQNVGSSMVLLAQGVPFVQAGQDILRSKSTDRNSYDSGDWFNEIDWTLATGKWGVGLPPQGDNLNSKAQATAILRDPTAAPGQADRAFASEVFREFLEIRKSSQLFRLRTAEQIKTRMKMLNTGPSQQPGVIAYRLDGCASAELTQQPFGAIVTIFNPTDGWTQLPLFKDETFVLHPVLANSVDATVKTATHDASGGFRVPPRTTAVFVKTAQSSCSPYGVPMFVRGIGGDWTANPDRELQFTSGTTYVRTITAPAGAQEFKIADNDWTAARNCGGAVAGVTMAIGKPQQLSCADGTQNLKFAPAAAGNYVFTLNAASTQNPYLTISNPAPFGATTMFVRGGFNDWGNGPSPTAPLAWDGITTYRAEILNLPAGSFEFKVADSGWTDANNCGRGGSAPATYTFGQSYPLTCANGTGNIGITFPSAGSYLFAMSGSSPSTMQLTVEKLPFAAALYIRGLQDDWSSGAGNRMAYLGGGVYSLAKVLNTGADDFKIADADWTSGTDCGSSGTLAIGTPLTLACASPGNGNISLNPPAAGRYQFSLNATNPTAPQLTVTGP